MRNKGVCALCGSEYQGVFIREQQQKHMNPPFLGRGQYRPRFPCDYAKVYRGRDWIMRRYHYPVAATVYRGYIRPAENLIREGRPMLRPIQNGQRPPRTPSRRKKEGGGGNALRTRHLARLGPSTDYCFLQYSFLASYPNWSVRQARPARLVFEIAQMEC